MVARKKRRGNSKGGLLWADFLLIEEDGLGMPRLRSEAVIAAVIDDVMCETRVKDPSDQPVYKLPWLQTGFPGQSTSR